MNALELIKILATIVQEHGDCPISLFESDVEDYGSPIQMIDCKNGVIRII